MINALRLIAAPALLLVSIGAAQAAMIEFDFRGNAGDGLLPGNENPPVVSTASGGETGGGLVYDTDTGMLSLEFEFDGLTGGLFDAADGGIHLHLALPADPFGTNGGVAFNLNSGFANIAEGATGGSMDLDLALSAADEANLFAGLFYLNIHSEGSPSGELRANLVRVSESGTLALFLAGLAGLAMRRRRVS